MKSIESIQKAVDEAKQDAIKLAKELAEVIEALKPLGLAEAILNDKEFRKYTAVLGVTASEPAPAKRKTGKTAKRVKRGERSDEILKILGDKKLKTGEINSQLTTPSANPSALLTNLRKAGKIGKTGDKWHKV